MHRKLTQQEYCSGLNTCWKFHWVWLRSEKFLLNELDFYLEERGLEWKKVSSPPFDLKTNSTTVRQLIEHLLKVSLNLDAIWEHFIKWAGLLLSKKKKKTGNSEIHSVRLENFLNRSPTVNKTSAESFMKFGCDLRNFY